MAKLQPIVCPLSERPKNYSRSGLKYVNGKWVSLNHLFATGAVESHVSKVLKGKEKYYV
jgi:hypothetical protein